MCVSWMIWGEFLFDCSATYISAEWAFSPIEQVQKDSVLDHFWSRTQFLIWTLIVNSFIVKPATVSIVISCHFPVPTGIFIWGAKQLFSFKSSYRCLSFFFNWGKVHITKLILLKWAIKWHLVHSHYCATINTIHFQSSSCKTETLYPSQNHPPALSPSLGNTHYYFFKVLHLFGSVGS